MTVEIKTQVLLPKQALPLPEGLNVSTIKNWLEYGIWGLVLYDNQAPWFALIECMQILHSLHQDGKPLFPGPTKDIHGNLVHERDEYVAPINKNLRHLLFRDREVMKLKEVQTSDPLRLWGMLRAKTLEDTGGKIDLGYLQHAFSDFDTFANALDLLRSAEVESFGAQRWTSRHLLPLGPNMLFADIDENDRNDRLIFRRTGEILWLMMGRASVQLRTRLTEIVRDRLLIPDNPWNRLAGKIAHEPGKKIETARMTTGYLPMPWMNVYDSLAEDWCSLLSISGMPVEMLLDPLMRLSGLHQIIYVLRRCEMELNGTPFPPLVLDISGSARRNPIQKLSADLYDNHRKLPLRAAEAYLDDYTSSEEWIAVLDRISRKIDAYNLVDSRFLWPRGKSPPLEANISEPQEHLGGVFHAYQKSSHTIWSMIANHGRKIGLVAARQKAGTWYYPSDSFIEALVLANVTTPMEIGQFLRKLHQRYNIVIGAKQARDSFGDDGVSLEPFNANLARLEERLGILGCIDRKSDACAFVVNPYYS
ncbi:hypothetical protein DC522_19045 [Microvirga sp. KLBC 81]|uniref:hypothetical protein n=1 Tax=Microvirga sp. KLBC 81 TaxID=1862707 RepID=UPI000D513359|nr:hypothetical protein [Microvirga sp. KLBC 81]PVE22838.1 hypothetical protein DC522_19045 [Microvirga sp. KLBC 81]